ncbi:hypothetical protein BD626DRAFT_217798 [Schizophyllum amplum]|uniref:Methyltransferase-domain-containing protein n=1 Tax=Schizophyllum amplum TaxID=97359 RepID=A0A550CKU7_9AGAR|nr:hypothetical protein BD626DRAFT_217798 [Auriculariopsis ampla]
MFYYLSFLRPPPTFCSPSSTSTNAPKGQKAKPKGAAGPSSSLLSITVQIGNDLRTEALVDPAGRDIFYSWIKDTSNVSGGASSTAPQTTTPPAKITTYRTDSAYKEVPVPIPRLAKQGEMWRLALWCDPPKRSNARPRLAPRIAIDLWDAALGSGPLPVLSQPITFDARVHAPEKQVRIDRVYRLGPFASASDAAADELLLTITEHTGYDLDKKIWDSGIGLSSWICGLAHATSEAECNDLVQKMRRALFGLGGRRIIELGAGTGIMSLALAALRYLLRSQSTSTRSEARPDDVDDVPILNQNEKDDQNGGYNQPEDEIFITDLSSALPLLEHNIQQNKHLLGRPVHKTSATDTARSDARAGEAAESLQALELDWDAPTIPDAIARGGALDLIIMADVTYNTDSFPALISTVRRLIDLNVPPKPPPMILLGYKQRHPDERALWDMAQQEAGVKFVRVGERRGFPRSPEEVTGHGEGEVEVWIGTVQK